MVELKGGNLFGSWCLWLLLLTPGLTDKAFALQVSANHSLEAEVRLATRVESFP